MTGVEEGVSYVRFLLFSVLFQGCVIVFAVVVVIVVGVVVSFFCASEGFNSSEVTSSSSEALLTNPNSQNTLDLQHAASKTRKSQTDDTRHTSSAGNILSSSLPPLRGQGKHQG